MAQKSNPTSLRLEKTNRRWASIWYGDHYYTTQFLQGAQISAYLENISSQGKFPSPVVFLTRGRQQVQMALFFPKNISTRLARRGKRATERNSTRDSADRLRRVFRRGGERSASGGERWAESVNLSSNLSGESAEMSTHAIDLLRGCVEVSTPILRCQELSMEFNPPGGGVEDSITPPVELPRESTGGVGAQLALRHLFLHFFATGVGIASGGRGESANGGAPGFFWGPGAIPPLASPLSRKEVSASTSDLLAQSMEMQQRTGVSPGWAPQGGVGVGPPGRGGGVTGIMHRDRPRNLPESVGGGATRGSTPLRDHLEWCIHRQLNCKCEIHFLMVHSVWQNPLFLASHIVSLLQEKMSFRRLKDQIIRDVTRGGRVKGIRITCSGRVASRSKKAQKAKKESIQWGETGLHVFSSLLSFASKSAHTSFGQIGVKVWICYG